MAQTNQSIFVDSGGASWGSLGPGWVEVVGSSFWGDSSAWARDNDSTSIAFNFTGVGISYVGNEIGGIPWNYTSSVDGDTPEYHAITHSNPNITLTYAWYTSPPLRDGDHILELSKMTRGIAIDYILIQPSRTQLISGNRLIVDDSDPLIKFSGSWNVSDDHYPNDSRERGHYFVPHGGKTHISNQVGDILQFPFTGTSVHVYGFYDWTLSGELSISFFIDDWPEENIDFPRRNDNRATHLVQPNFLYYETTVPAGDHILTVNVTNITGRQRAMIDAIHYTASFDTLENMPQILVEPPIPHNSKETPSGVPSSSPSSSVDPNKQSRGTNVGTIVGGVIGGVLGLALVVGIAWLLVRRRRFRKTGKDDILHSNMTVDPFTQAATSARSGWSDWHGAPVVSRPPIKRDKTADTSTPPDTVGLAQPGRYDRVDELERQVQQLARQTEELQQSVQDGHTAPPPSYDGP